MAGINEKNPQLKHTIDHYNGVHITEDSLGNDELKFGRALEASLLKWQKEERKGVWLTIPTTHSHFIPIVVELGFQFYYCDSRAVVLTKWLPKTTSTLPHGPRHLIGVGGFVVNDKKEILVVKEKSGIATAIWKIPGGAVDPGEDIDKAVVREVLEETGIKTEFVSVLGFRTHHQARLGLSDMYITCFLKPLSHNIQIQESEIADAKWMPLDEFMSLPYYKGVYQKLMQLGNEASKGNYTGFTMETLPGALKSMNTIYHGLAARL
jgi:ADP-ribose pyrophosphatase YjhB (NUDIX family)